MKKVTLSVLPIVFANSSMLSSIAKLSKTLNSITKVEIAAIFTLPLLTWTFILAVPVSSPLKTADNLAES